MGASNLQTTNRVLLEVKGLKTYFPLEEGTVRAVDGADFVIERGKTLAVVGESGCGKSVTAQSILRIVPPPGRIIEGELLFHRYTEDKDTFEVADVIDLTKLDPKGKEIRSIRGNEIAMVFQEPMTSLSPVHTMGNQIIETIMLHQQVSKAEARERAIDMLARVGMPRPSVTVDSYPFELSGGMRQRGMIAMALSCQPSLLIADEPTTALDVVVQRGVIQLLKDVQQRERNTLVIVTHDMGVHANLDDRTAVLYAGMLIEEAPTRAIFKQPLHPYTQFLIRSLPALDDRSERVSIPGTPPALDAVPPGCRFHPRCPYAMEICTQSTPELLAAREDHRVACFLVGRESP